MKPRSGAIYDAMSLSPLRGLDCFGLAIRGLTPNGTFFLLFLR
jgi:hypothetical protein